MLSATALEALTVKSAKHMLLALNMVREVDISSHHNIVRILTSLWYLD